jgi:hypothetical protein
MNEKPLAMMSEKKKKKGSKFKQMTTPGSTECTMRSPKRKNHET